MLAYNMAKVRLQTARMYCWRAQAEEAHETFTKAFNNAQNANEIIIFTIANDAKKILTNAEDAEKKIVTN